LYPFNADFTIVCLCWWKTVFRVSSKLPLAIIPPGNLLLNFHSGFAVLGGCNSRFDLQQFVLNFGEIGSGYDTLFIRKVRMGFQPPNSSFQGGAIDHPQDKEDQQRSERGK